MIKILPYNEQNLKKIFERGGSKKSVAGSVSKIIKAVQNEGDAALLRYSEEFDGVALSALEVTPAEIDEAYRSIDPKLIGIMRTSAANIMNFHEKQVKNGFVINDHKGSAIGQRVLPIEKVGLYVPGGTAAYPSSVLMNCVPAKIAGCKEIVMVTPPSKDGSVNPAILAAAKIVGVNRVFKIGGAQAVAALAYGTESIPKVDKIFGPGNAYVAEAKKQVFGTVAIDMIAGPSEILIIADQGSNPRHLAADLLSQAEHDKMASAVLLVTDKDLAKQVSEELEKQIPLLPRCEIARESIDKNGKIIIAKSMDEMIDISNEIAPEHLELCMNHSFDYLGKIKNAGSIFMGYWTPEALGDYFAGPNHTLPTSGTARFSSPLSVDDFYKKSQYIYYTKEALSRAAGSVARFADEEGLNAHAISAKIRFEEENEPVSK